MVVCGVGILFGNSKGYMISATLHSISSIGYMSLSATTAGDYVYQRGRLALFNLLVLKENVKRTFWSVGSKVSRTFSSLSVPAMFSSTSGCAPDHDNNNNSTTRPLLKWIPQTNHRVRPLEQQVVRAELVFGPIDEEPHTYLYQVTPSHLFLPCTELFREFLKDSPFDDGHFVQARIQDFIEFAGESLESTSNIEVDADTHSHPSHLPHTDGSQEGVRQQDDNQAYLVVEYKRGLRTYGVVYSNSLVFPPPSLSPLDRVNPALVHATPSTLRPVRTISKVMLYNNDELANEEGVEAEEEAEPINITASVKRFAGPLGDFYAGTDFATLPCWIVRSMRGTICESHLLEVTMSDATTDEETCQVKLTDKSMPDLHVHSLGKDTISGE